jgi:hypothetical protein
MVYIKLIWSFLTDRKFYVTVAGERFADDSALFSTHAKADVNIDRLQSVLNTIKRYYSNKLNPSKTQAEDFEEFKSVSSPF